MTAPPTSTGTIERPRVGQRLADGLAEVQALGQGLDRGAAVGAAVADEEGSPDTRDRGRARRRAVKAFWASDAWEVVAEHWGIALAMAAGSYVAGSTPMGGGTVGFPILVLVFDQSASLGRDFGFAIQSIGMTSASIFILCTGRPLERRLLLWAMLGSLVATPVAVAFFAPHVDERS